MNCMRWETNFETPKDRVDYRRCCCQGTNVTKKRNKAKKKTNWSGHWNKKKDDLGLTLLGTCANEKGKRQGAGLGEHRTKLLGEEKVILRKAGKKKDAGLLCESRGRQQASLVAEPGNEEQ